jgi:ferritin-like metal-binding protein YciE
MSPDKQKVVQYLNEAHATEVALVRVLQSQIAMTPRGGYRSALERHLGETRDHARRVEERLSALGAGTNPVQVVVGAVETAIGQALALGKTPFDLLRGTGGEEKVLKNARDASATEALEIATYTSLERLAQAVGDTETARLAASIRRDEERMLEQVLREIPKLTDAVVGADVEGNGSYDVATTGAGETVRRGARKASGATRRTARQARRVPGVARAEGEAKGAVASAEDLPIPRYDALNADDIARRLAQLSQVDLGKVDAYERRHESRTTVLSRIDALRGDEPWPGYDDQTAAEIERALAEADDDRARRVRDYERSHKDRAGVLRAAERRYSAV